MSNEDRSLDSINIAIKLVEYLGKYGLDRNEPQTDRLIKRITSMMTYIPIVGVLGKSGVGKSSICNAMFGSKVAETSDVLACTKERANYEVTFTKEGKGIIFTDLPGMDDGSTDYSNLYQEVIPGLDLVIWVVAANDRALKSDIEIYNEIIFPILTKNNKPFITIVNQADLMHPDNEWDVVKCCPGATQSVNLELKREWLANNFGIPHDRTIAISAKKDYNLSRLLTLMIDVLPNARKIAIYRSATQKNKNAKAKDKAEKGLLEEIIQIMKNSPELVKELVEIFMSWIES